MKIIFAQGNPGVPYMRTRHNVGFTILDILATKEDATWRSEKKFGADIAEVTLEGEKTLLVKPLSFYNETGPVARRILDFYKLSAKNDFLVIHDELALPFGTIRVREKGSDAGNNGIKSLNAHLGSDYWRVRVGVWNEKRNFMKDADFVLSTFSADETDHLTQQAQQVIIPLLREFTQGTLKSSSHLHEA